MRIAILESIIMPAGHEVEFDRIIIDELRRQGHEPLLFVPKGFVCKVDYDAEVVYLDGGSIVTYAGASKWKKPFLSILRENRRRQWFSSAAEKIKEYKCDALIIPTGTYRYIKALLDSKLRDVAVPIHLILHGIDKGEMNRFIKQAKRLIAHTNIFLDVISLRTDMLHPDIPNIRRLLPPVFLPSELVKSRMEKQEIKLGFFGQFRKEKNIELILDAFIACKVPDNVSLVVQGATAKPEDGALFKEIIRKYEKYRHIHFLHKNLIGAEWDQALMDVDAILMPYGVERYRYHWSAMLFTAIGFNKPVLVSPEINPEVLANFNVGEILCIDSLDTTIDGLRHFIDRLIEAPDRYRMGLQSANEAYSQAKLVESLIDIGE